MRGICVRLSSSRSPSRVGLDQSWRARNRRAANADATPPFLRQAPGFRLDSARHRRTRLAKSVRSSRARPCDRAIASRQDWDRWPCVHPNRRPRPLRGASTSMRARWRSTTPVSLAERSLGQPWRQNRKQGFTRSRNPGIKKSRIKFENLEMEEGAAHACPEQWKGLSSSKHGERVLCRAASRQLR